MTAPLRPVTALFVLLATMAPLSPARAREEPRNVLHGVFHVTAERLARDDLLRIDQWRYHPGDDPAWADPAYDDSGWQLADSNTIPCCHDERWPGIGWFRVHLVVDPDVARETLGLTLFQNGASELYLDGEPLLTTGQVAATAAEEHTRYDHASPHPLPLSGRSERVLALRFSNHSFPQVLSAMGGGGIRVYLSSLATGVAQRVDRERFVGAIFLLFSALPLTLTVIHLGSFLFYRGRRAHLYFALFALVIAVLNSLEVRTQYLDTPHQVIPMLRIFPVTAVLLLGLGLLTAYSLYTDRVPVQARILLAVGVGLAAWGAARPSVTSYSALAILAAVVCAEWLRATVVAVLREGRRIALFAAGVGAFVVALVYQQAVNFGLANDPFELPIYYVGVGVLLFCVSLQLSYSMAETSRDLQGQLRQVRELSERSLRQEREAREREIQQRLLEAEHRRKTEELEEARRLQLSMLPQRIPEVGGFDIDVHLRTATEVGGDYYDFVHGDDGSLTVAVGDATGHGMAAGIMVTAAKALFQSSAAKGELLPLMRSFSRTIRGLRLDHLHMALTLVRLHSDHASVVAAGMPPILIHRASTREIDEVALPGMPLGSWSDFPYRERRIRLGEGDVVLMMSDGLAEWADGDGEVLGYRRIAHFFRESCQGEPRKILPRLVERAEQLRIGCPLQDDMTLLVLRRVPVAVRVGTRVAEHTDP
jgi:serine phosphatase RsbU (regulator of sigma subunit)